MLAKILAIAVGSGSFILFMAAFFFPEVYRKGDFVWSGFAAFYAIVLWFCAGQATGAELLGETASVVLIFSLGGQLLVLRRQKTPIDQQTSTAAIASPGSGGLLGLFRSSAESDVNAAPPIAAEASSDTTDSMLDDDAFATEMAAIAAKASDWETDKTGATEPVTESAGAEDAIADKPKAEPQDEPSASEVEDIEAAKAVTDSDSGDASSDSGAGSSSESGAESGAAAQTPTSDNT